MKDLGNFGGANDYLGPFIYGLNNRGEVTGNMALPGDQTAHAFLWDGKKLIDLNAGGGLGGTYSQPSAKALVLANTDGWRAGTGWYPREIAVNERMKLLAKYPWMRP